MDVYILQLVVGEKNEEELKIIKEVLSFGFISKSPKFNFVMLN